VALSDNTHGWSKTFINEEEERLVTGFRKQKTMKLTGSFVYSTGSG